MRSVPGTRYTDPEFLDVEKTRVFRKAWVVACPLWQVAKAGDFFCFEQFGASVIIVRDAQGELRAFQNTCLHRGSRLLEGAGNTPEIRCRYHGWRYGLDGHLEHVPRPDGFEELACEKMHLHRVRLRVLLGFVWITLSKDAPELEQSLGGIAEELAPYELSQMRPIQEKVFPLPTNWKAVLENATDFYHVPFVHSSTVTPHVATGPDMRSYGDNTRQTLHIAPYGWRGWLDDKCSRGGPYTRKQKSSLHKYLIFPNFLINVLPYHLTVMQVWPVEADKCELHYAFCRRKGARGIELARAYATWGASRYILREDLHILKWFQEGVATDAVRMQRLHEEEEAAAHFHGVLSKWVERA
ncbi:MAG: aromatic ring-hydroxylating dioxygenase subunit alpha [Deltaproteobacteria bacterium]|nr:aromatic ring-hydroxylating dioxygenase subunit alpha [Deltaproteobacteria bacterium]